MFVALMLFGFIAFVYFSYRFFKAKTHWMQGVWMIAYMAAFSMATSIFWSLMFYRN